jgi:hypothetical protein
MCGNYNVVVVVVVVVVVDDAAAAAAAAAVVVVVAAAVAVVAVAAACNYILAVVVPHSQAVDALPKVSSFARQCRKSTSALLDATGPAHGREPAF